MSYPRIFSKVLNSNWAISHSTLESIFMVLTNRSSNLGGAQGLESDSTKPKAAENGITKLSSNNAETAEDKTAVLFFSGIIGKHLSAMDVACAGGLDNNTIAESLKLVAADDSIKTVILHLDTPGGTVHGVPEVAAQIRKLTESKLVIGFVDSLCASAGYWIISGCDYIFATPSADVGSVGVYCAMMDYCAWMEQNGMKTELFKAGELKAMGMPGTTLSDGMREKLQADVDELYSDFVADVQLGRAKDSKEIDSKYLQGQTHSAKNALAAGLIDGVVNDLDELLALV
jgi:signal peptide peptidase SppA